MRKVAKTCRSSRKLIDSGPSDLSFFFAREVSSGGKSHSVDGDIIKKIFYCRSRDLMATFLWLSPARAVLKCGLCSTAFSAGIYKTAVGPCELPSPAALADKTGGVGKAGLARSAHSHFLNTTAAGLVCNETARYIREKDNLSWSRVSTAWAELGICSSRATGFQKRQECQKVFMTTNFKLFHFYASLPNTDGCYKFSSWNHDQF